MDPIKRLYCANLISMNTHHDDCAKFDVVKNSDQQPNRNIQAVHHVVNTQFLKRTKRPCSLTQSAPRQCWLAHVIWLPFAHRMSAFLELETNRAKWKNARGKPCWIVTIRQEPQLVSMTMTQVNHLTRGYTRWGKQKQKSNSQNQHRHNASAIILYFSLYKSLLVPQTYEKTPASYTSLIGFK